MKEKKISSKDWEKNQNNTFQIVLTSRQTFTEEKKKNFSLFIDYSSEALQYFYREVPNLELILTVENIPAVEIKTKHNLNLANKSLLIK